MSTMRIGSIERDETTGEIRVDINDQDEMKSLFKELLQTPIGKVYRADYYDANRDDSDTIISQAARAAGRDMVSLYDLGAALKTLMHANVIPKKVKRPVINEPAAIEEIVDDTPRDKNGKVLTQAQLKFGEMRRFAETASADAVRQRSHTDAEFTIFVQSQLRKEMQSEIGDAVEPAGQSSRTVKASQALRDFVLLYQREPSANLRAINGMVRLGGEQVPLATFNDLLSRAADAKLI